MEQRLQEVLLDGEIVRWSGRPSPFKLMSIPSRTSPVSYTHLTLPTIRLV